MVPARVSVVCMALGDAYPDLYTVRLHSMLGRHMPVPFELTCVTDRPRRLPSEIRTMDCRGWGMERPGMRVTTNKLRLYDPELFPGEFLYLDTTLVIGREMTPLLEFAFARPEALVVVRDWQYDVYNTCVMRIRNGTLEDPSPLRVVYDRFREGRAYPHRTPGDQDFASACLRSEGLEGEIATFLPQHVVSYKAMRRKARADLSGATAEMNEAVVVKFHGKPKMDQLLSPFYRWRKGLRTARVREDLKFWLPELRERWR